MGFFCIDCSQLKTDEDWQQFYEFMDYVAVETEKHILQLSKDLGISASCANDIFYLRTRARWTQAAEDELIRRDKAGEPAPNIMEWP